MGVRGCVVGGCVDVLSVCSWGGFGVGVFVWPVWMFRGLIVAGWLL